MELEIFDAIITIHNSIKYVGQDITTKNINQTYYSIICKKIIYLIKLYEICYLKALNKYKNLFKPIISTKPFERVQIDFINIRSTSNVISKGIYKLIAHLVYYISKIHILFVLPNKKATTLIKGIN